MPAYLHFLIFNQLNSCQVYCGGPHRLKMLSIDVMNIEQWHCQSHLMLTCEYNLYDEQTLWCLAKFLENISTNENYLKFSNLSSMESPQKIANKNKIVLFQFHMKH